MILLLERGDFVPRETDNWSTLGSANDRHPRGLANGSEERLA